MADKKSGSKLASATEVFNKEFVAPDGTTFAVAEDARAPRETIQKGDRFYIPEYAAIIAQPRTFVGTDGEDVTIMTAERIPVVKLDRNGKPIKGTVLWVSQICPQDVNRIYAFDSEINDFRQEGTLVSNLKGHVLTAMETATIMARKWDSDKNAYAEDENGNPAGAPKVVFRWSHNKASQALDLDAADALLKKYLDAEYPGLLA